jgi:hypothetical protein
MGSFSLSLAASWPLANLLFLGEIGDTHKIIQSGLSLLSGSISFILYGEYLVAR